MRSIQSLILPCLLTLLSILLSGCDRGSAKTAAASAKPRIVCTIAMIADLTQRIAGERADVSSLMGSGVDPHLFKPTRSDIALLNNADLILANGLLLEGKMGETFDRLAASGKKVVRVAESTPSGSTRRLGEHADPHVWMDPNLWSIAAVQMRDALIALMPAHKDEFESRARDVVADLARLNAYAAEAFATIPPTSRVLITAHDAFGYLGARYSIEVEGIQGISTESEAGLRDLERLATLIAQRKIRAVFVESTVSERTINSLAKAARDKGQDVIIGGSLFSDAIGKPGTYEGTYIGMIDHNVTTIVRALGGTAPERGMENKLAPSTQERKPGAGT
jgi:manganese/zinc/iron transport system substrate-binding protein